MTEIVHEVNPQPEVSSEPLVEDDCKLYNPNPQKVELIIPIKTTFKKILKPWWEML